MELGPGDLVGDGCAAAVMNSSSGRLLACPVTNVLPPSRTGGNCTPAAYSARPPDQVRASCAVHSAWSVGLDRAKITGRWFSSAIAWITSRVKALPLVLTPMITVGRSDLMTSAKSADGGCGWA